jgi:hypothetical protein
LTSKKNQGRRNEEKNNIPLMSLQIISKRHAKILETLETFPLLFPTFSFVFLHGFEKKYQTVHH